MGMFKKPKVSIMEEPTNDESDYSDFDADSDADEVPVAEPSKNVVYNREGLLEKLEDIAWPESADWIHRLSVDYEQTQEVDVNDDLARELAFYTQALDGTREAFEKFQSLKMPFLRPPDYYAEMVKTDSHMLKIKGKILVEKKKMEEAEERKKARESKKIAKEVQAQKNKERAKRKKEDIESVKKWRKQRQQSGFAEGKGEELDLGLDGPGSGSGSFERMKKRRPGVGPGDRSGGFRKQQRGGKQGGNKKREMKESRFGQGGQKGMRKQNTAETTDDLRGFNKGKSSGNKRRKR
ncbi:putative rRNA-processing protein EBP2-like protein [Iris pallida]|uniref:rRNA-processing protein EBP2-like protein n=1 Tax=Iris pallida TaxID=29817 RepID=A0AAX6FAL8_IRIPA|nr:putative rRNA-processing protein EBP2-like protein [Iris pallida]